MCRLRRHPVAESLAYYVGKLTLLGGGGGGKSHLGEQVKAAASALQSLLLMRYMFIEIEIKYSVLNLILRAKVVQFESMMKEDFKAQHKILCQIDPSKVISHC